jgi:hypothetical protein
MDPNATRWCPHCRAATSNAPLPQLGDVGQRIRPLADCRDPQGFRRQLYCTECGEIWSSIELPQDFITRLLADREALEDARRQIAVLRYYLAQARHASAGATAPSPAAQPLKEFRIAG